MKPPLGILLEAYGGRVVPTFVDHQNASVSHYLQAVVVRSHGTARQSDDYAWPERDAADREVQSGHVQRLFGGQLPVRPYASGERRDGRGRPEEGREPGQVVGRVLHGAAHLELIPVGKGGARRGAILMRLL